MGFLSVIRRWALRTDTYPRDFTADWAYLAIPSEVSGAGIVEPSFQTPTHQSKLDPFVKKLVRLAAD